MDMGLNLLPEIDEIEGLDAPPRMSQEINPQNLADLFADDPGYDALNKTNRAEAPLSQQVSRAMAFAGSGIEDEFEMKKLQVFVRIRPTATNNAAVNASTSVAANSSSHWDAENCIHAAAKHTLAIAPPEGSMAYKAGDRGQTFTFSQVFEAATTQEEYFSATAGPMVDDLLRNPQHNSVMMAYGITAAGKTYTIEGTKTAPGVLPRSLTALFDGIARHMDAESLAIRVSYCEIYNESVYDLIEEAHNGWGVQKRPALRLMEDARGRVSVAGLSEVEVTTAEEALGVLRRGAKHRQRAETGLNFSSSRSHSIFGINLVRRQDVQAPAEDAEDCKGVATTSASTAATLKPVQVERLGRMSFVDLAGSERAQRTGNVGIRLKESVAINSSLMTLGRCLEALRWNQQQQALSRSNATASTAAAAAGPLKVVPYRESKVTHLFRDALHGYGRVVLSVNVSPCVKDYDETAHVLRYASLATAIGTLQQAEAPRRTIKAVTPGALRRAKRKAAAKGAKDEAARKAKKAAEAAKEAERAAMEAELPKAAAEEAEPTPSIAIKGIAEPSTAYRNAAGCVDEDAATGATTVSAPAPAAPPSSATAAAALAGVAEGEEEVVYEVMGRRLLSDEFDNVAAAPSFAVPAASVGEKEATREELRELNDEDEVFSPNYCCVDAEEGLDFAGGAITPSTPCSDDYDDLEGEEEGEENEAIAALQAQVHQLLQNLQAAEERAVLLEGEVREEVAGEMAGLLKDMEESYRERLTAEVAAAEARAAKNAAAAKNHSSKGGGNKRKGGRDGNRRSNDTSENLEPSATSDQLEETTKALDNAQLEIASLRAELELHQAEAREQAERLAKAQEAASAACAAAEAATEELALVHARADSLAAVFAESRRRSEDVVKDRLREEVTQLEANAAMELEMAEQQAERLRKEKYRMAAACPSGGGGNGCGAAGTPHDLALARARQAAAAEDAAAAAAALAATSGDGQFVPNSSSQGRSTGHRSTGPSQKSRFGEEALAVAAAATGTQQTEIETLAVGLATQPEEVLCCGDKTPAAAVLHTPKEEEEVLVEEDLVQEQADHYNINNSNNEEEAMPENDSLLLSEAIKMKEQNADAQAALRSLEEAEAEAEKEVERLIALEQQQQQVEEEEEKEVVMIDAIEEKEEIDIMNAFSPVQEHMFSLGATGAGVHTVEEEEKEEVLEKKDEEENVKQQDLFLPVQEVAVVDDKVMELAVKEEKEVNGKPKRGGKMKALKQSKKAEKVVEEEQEQQPVVKKGRRGRKAAAAVQKEQHQELKPASAAKARGGKREKELGEEKEEVGVFQGKIVEGVEEVNQPLILEEEEELLSVVKPRARPQRRNVVLLDSSSDEEEEEQQVLKEEMEEANKEKEEPLSENESEEEAEPVSEEDDEENNSSDVDYNPTSDEDKEDSEEEEEVGGGGEAQKENENEPPLGEPSSLEEPVVPTTEKAVVVAPGGVKEQARRQTRRASRAVSTSTIPKPEEKVEAAPAPKPAAAAPVGRKRRLLQVSKPLSTEMRSALGELAGADVSGGVSTASKRMPVTKKGRSMAMALGLSPAPARQKSPKRSRRPLSTGLE
ncbi:hypothetical protein Ndes2526B_g07967 [Nannochloris sp. 'desiccata']